MNNRRGKRKKGKWRIKNKRCFLTINKIEWVDYKDKHLLSKFLNKQGKILPATLTDANAKQQRRLAVAIKRARHIGVLPFTKESIIEVKSYRKGVSEN